MIWTRTNGNEGSRGIDTKPQLEEAQGDTHTKRNETKLTAYAYVDSRPAVREQDGGDMTDPKERRKRGCTCYSRASVCHFNAYIVPFSCLLVEVHEQAAPQLVHEPGQEVDVTPSRGAVDRQLAARTGGDATYGTIRRGGKGGDETPTHFVKPPVYRGNPPAQKSYQERYWIQDNPLGGKAAKRRAQ